MRIVSLLPSATEILFALGFDKEIVGVSHECDFPPQARTKKTVIHSRIPQDVAPVEIDRLVREFVERGESLYTVDAQALEELQPDLIITQDLCHVCAASPEDLVTALAHMPERPEVLCLNPQELGDVWRDILWVGEATCRGNEAEALLEKIGARLGEIEQEVGCAEDCPRVAILEWLQPFYVAGHWVPEMIEAAGGRDVLGKMCTPSFRVTVEDVIVASPEVLFIAPCGYGAKQARDEYRAMPFPAEWSEIPAVRDGRVYALDASAYLSRPGPRLVTGIEALAGVLHPGVEISLEAQQAALPIHSTAAVPATRRAASV